MIRGIGQPSLGQAPFDSEGFERLKKRRPDNRVLGIVSTDVTLDSLRTNGCGMTDASSPWTLFSM